MSYKKGLSKTRFKASMRMFWTEKWKYEKTPEEWVEALKSEPESRRHGSRMIPPGMPQGKRAEDLLFSAIDKLVLERKLLKEQSKNLKEMLSSPDPENTLVAITIMAALKPKKFKKITTKNTETNE